MPGAFIIQITHEGRQIDVPATLEVSGAEAAKKYRAAVKKGGGSHVLLTGDRDYYATVGASLLALHHTVLTAAKGRYVLAVFPGRAPVRRALRELKLGTPTATTPATTAAAIDLTETVAGRDPLWILADGTFSTRGDRVQRELDARDALINAARWISSRRTSSFERLFPPSAFHPDVAPRTERVTSSQATAMLDQVRGALRVAAVGSAEARRDATAAAQLRSAALTVLSHMIATALRDVSWRPSADLAAAEVFSLIAAEQGDPTARAQLRAHAIMLLQLRAPALSAQDRARAAALVRTLVRESPPYASFPATWNFAMCSAWDFHEGECEVIVKQHGFTEVRTPSDAPKPPSGGTYRVFEAPFKNPSGGAIRVFSRSATPTNENHEMGFEFFVGMLINRHAQLGSFDMRATSTAFSQRGYKFMMNSQCAGLTTRFALSRMFPDADIYSSWDSTYFRTSGGKVSESEGLDCFVAALQGLARGESHTQIARRMRAVQWWHPQTDTDRDFNQFVGPAHPLIVARYSDVNHDAKGDFYDGFLDLMVRDVATEMSDGISPKDPGAKATQVGGAAARSLAWAVGSMNRVTQYSDLWAALPGRAEMFYVYEAAGYFSHKEPPHDVPTGPFREDLGRLPAVCRYYAAKDISGGIRAEVMFHAYLAHAPEELKRLLVAAECMTRAFDLKHLPTEGRLGTPQARRGAVLLTLAGLLEFPADQNRLDALWATALRMLNLPDISRSTVRKCITNIDHDASNYYGSVRGLTQLVGTGADRGELGRADAIAWERLASADPSIGRALPLTL